MKDADTAAIRYYTLLGRTWLAFFAEEIYLSRTRSKSDKHRFRNQDYVEHFLDGSGNAVL